MQSPQHVIIVHVGSLVRSSCVLHRRTTPAVHDRGRPRPTPSRGYPVPMTNDDRTLLRQAQCPGRRSLTGQRWLWAPRVLPLADGDPSAGNVAAGNGLPTVVALIRTV